MSVALVPCASAGEIGEALTRALDLAEQIEALVASIRGGLASEIRLGEHEWKLGLLSARAVSLTALCAQIDVADAMAGSACDAPPARLSAAA